MNDTEAAKLLFAEFDKAHNLYWSLFNKFSLAILTISIIPYVKPDIVQPLGSIKYAFPGVALLVTICCTWILAAEYQRTRMVRIRYDQIMGDYKPVRMPQNPRREKLVAKPIGPAVSIMFGLGFTVLCFLNMWALSMLPLLKTS